MKEESVKWTTKVFGKYFEQPLDKTLKDFRLVSIICFFLAWNLMYKVWDFIAEGSLSDTEFALAVVGFAVTIFGTIWKAFNHIQDRIYHDEAFGGRRESDEK